MEKATDLENMKIMEETYSKHAFPQDTASTAFSSTSIYFKPMDTAAVQVTGATHTQPLKAAQSTTRADKPAETACSAFDNPPSKLADSPVTSSNKVASLASATSEGEQEPSQGSHTEASKDKKIHQAASDTVAEAEPQKLQIMAIPPREMEHKDTNNNMNNKTTHT